jgi:malate/lactate dehydrogenase
MAERGLKYFEKISKLSTPAQSQGQYNESYDQMCGSYCMLRNTAREVLKGELLEDIGRKKIKGLLKRIDKLSKDTVTEHLRKRGFYK